MKYDAPGAKPVGPSGELSPFGEVLTRLAHRRGLESLPEIGERVEAKGHLWAWEELLGLVYEAPGPCPRSGFFGPLSDALELSRTEEDDLLKSLVAWARYRGDRPASPTAEGPGAASGSSEGAHWRELRGSVFGEVLSEPMGAREIPATAAAVRELALRAGLDGGRLVARMIDAGADGLAGPGELGAVASELGLTGPEEARLAVAYAFERR